MQIEKYQRKINFSFVGGNFPKNLQLAITLSIIQFQAFH